MSLLSLSRAKELLAAARRTRAMVVGDVMLDQFIWGRVSRISPEAPVPVVEFGHESWMPGGAANVARNLASLAVPTHIFSIVGDDDGASTLGRLLRELGVDSEGLKQLPGCTTNIKTRIIAHRQQVVRLDREPTGDMGTAGGLELLQELEGRLGTMDAVIVGDYGKGVVTQELLDKLKGLCQRNGIWLSLDPKPIHHLDLSGLSLITPNRQEAFELAQVKDRVRAEDPLQDDALLQAAERLLEQWQPRVLLITLGELGMLLCRPGQDPFHIATLKQEVSDVSGAGDTVIAAFTTAMAAGASPEEAATLANLAAGVVVGKLGTATVSPQELLEQLLSPS